MCARVRVVLFAEIHVVVILFLEQNLGRVAGERDMRLERVRLRNLTEALQVSILGGKRERLLGAVAADRRHPDVIGGRQRAAFAPDPPPWGRAVFEDLQRQRLPSQRDRLRLVVMVMLLVLLPPGAPDHPASDADDDDGRSQLQVRLTALPGQFLAEVEACECDYPDDRGVGDGCRQSEEHGLKDGAPDGDDECRHHGLRMTRLETVQCAEKDRAGHE